MLVKYNKITHEVLGVFSGCIDDIPLEKDEDVKELDLQSGVPTDIRMYNEDGSVKTLGEQIKQGLVRLAEDEVVKDGIVVKLDKRYEDDYIRLVQRGLENLDENNKIEYDKINKRYYITEKSLYEKYISGLIGDIEYNKQIVNNRIGMYSYQIDPLFIEFMQEYFSTIKLPKELKEKFNSILEKKQVIKEEYPKTTSDNFKQHLIEKLNIDVENIDNLDSLIVKE